VSTLLEFRKRKGYTITDLSEVTHIDVDRLRGLEEHRRRMTNEEAEILAEHLQCHPTTLLQDNQKYAIDNTTLDFFNKYAQIPFTTSSKIQTFIDVFNDLWYWANNEASLGSESTEEDVYRELLYFLVKRRANKEELSFPFTSKDGCIAWTTVYLPPRTDKPTVVFEYISGPSVTNTAEYFIRDFVEQRLSELLDVGAWMDKGRSCGNVKFLELSYEDGEANYTEIKIIDGKAQFRKATFMTPEGKESSDRMYRTTVHADTHPEPFLTSQGDDRSKFMELFERKCRELNEQRLRAFLGYSDWFTSTSDK
jgi:transcriptional regulator with XRE-family HTH domain